jgi:uncharacterized protein (DUF1800 family)
MPVTPYSGSFTREDLKHLLRRAMFGATNADINYFNGQSLTQVVDALLNTSMPASVPLKNYWTLNNGTRDPNAMDPAVAFGTTWVNTPNVVAAVNANVGRMYSYFSWTVGQMIHQDRTIHEKMRLFWYNHIAVQVSVVFNGLLWWKYDQLLRQHSLGNFRQMMYDISIDPCMLEFLNGDQNMASAPDENYARELMELYTLGEGSGYTEQDVQAAARVLTGWNFREYIGSTPIMPEAYFTEGNHSTANKQFSGFFNNNVIQGQSGANGGTTELNALLDMITGKNECSLFICRKLYQFFVHGQISPEAEAELVVPLAELFRANSGSPDQMKIVMRALLTSAHFFNTDNRACMMMSPADIIIGMVRKLKYTFPSESTNLEARYRMFLDIYYICVNCEQNLFDPPNVAGWPAYHQSPLFDEIWVDSAAYAARNFAVQGLIGQGFNTGTDFYQAASRNVAIDPDYMAIVAEFSNPSDPSNIVNGCADLLYAIDISAGVKATLKTQRLLLGQSSDAYWTEAYQLRAADPNTTNQTAQMVPSLINFLLLDMAKAAETQLF